MLEVIRICRGEGLRSSRSIVFNVFVLYV